MLAGVIDYNFLCFREAIQQVFDLKIVKSTKDSPGLPANGLGSLPATSVAN